MGCKQYARILGLSRGYPYILYLSLSKWDATLSVPFFHKVTFFLEKPGGTVQLCHPRFAIVRIFRGLPGRGLKFPGRSRQHLSSCRGPAFQI
jgi:hypothetical protein